MPVHKSNTYWFSGTPLIPTQPGWHHPGSKSEGYMGAAEAGPRQPQHQNPPRRTCQGDEVCALRCLAPRTQAALQALAGWGYAQ